MLSYSDQTTIITYDCRNCSKILSCILTRLFIIWFWQENSKHITENEVEILVEEQLLVPDSLWQGHQIKFQSFNRSRNSYSLKTRNSHTNGRVIRSSAGGFSCSWCWCGSGCCCLNHISYEACCCGCWRVKLGKYGERVYWEWVSGCCCFVSTCRSWQPWKCWPSHNTLLFAESKIIFQVVIPYLKVAKIAGLKVGLYGFGVVDFVVVVVVGKVGNGVGVKWNPGL